MRRRNIKLFFTMQVLVKKEEMIQGNCKLNKQGVTSTARLRLQEPSEG